ncbi:bifunctional metallophosphatase/5'-nucleotidase [uncultured Prevotella sp.]|uniref:bifunctional metallophosphatase/5'-nucleotidase n=1 Tax=uncultured Prevotella sp. TaxID=159272 RepID=UPI00263765FD|nr:bifunctional metallophosphatase/5'-nucleotidase [uncultured Prevotella sp.]
MKYLLTAMLGFAALSNTMAQETKTVRLRLIETSDVHGAFFPYDFIQRRETKGSLARVSSYVNNLRREYGRNVILLDNGDILQGQPSCYYYNYVATDKQNIVSKIYNYMGYDAASFGNHDVEPGHKVYDKWVGEVDCPVLGANIVDTKTGLPYVKPYTIIERDGVKVAVLGMLTPAIPNWLEEDLWSGLKFEDIRQSARKWIAYLRKNEKPDVIVGLFHSGWDGGIETPQYMEDAVKATAEGVDGFDLIFFGHDHRARRAEVKGPDGNTVLCLDPSCNAMNVSDAEIVITKQDGKVVEKTVTGDVKDITAEPVDEAYVNHFAADIEEVKAYVGKKIGSIAKTMYTRDSFFGNSSFIDLIHNMQLSLTKADISFNAPLQFNAQIKEGPVYMSDMFKLYRFENKLCVMRMTGEEILRYLEMSYDLWVNTMKQKDDHIMLLDEKNSTDMQKFGFKNMTFNFDSAAGIDYEVDVTKPDGEKVRILRMTNGEKFDPKKWYRVAMNSYRANGGGELLTRGAGIPKEELLSRKVYESELDLRHYLAEEIKRKGKISPKQNNNWRFVPESWAKPALQRDRELLFGK